MDLSETDRLRTIFLLKLGFTRDGSSWSGLFVEVIALARSKANGM